MRRVVEITLILSIWLNVAYSQTVVKTLTLPGLARDFKEYNVAGGHPDFQNWGGQGCINAVERRIDTTNSSSRFPGDNRGPKFNSAFDILNGCYPPPAYGTARQVRQYESIERFNQWYNDRDTTINRPFLVPLRFMFGSDCIMRFRDSAFFPLNRSKEKYQLRNQVGTNSSIGCNIFGHLQPSFPDSNFGFTLEFHTAFTYYQGEHQTFAFSGDDDVWVFIKDSLVIDLGGLHSQQAASIDLDNLPAGFLQDGQEYKFDFFSAERHTDASNIRIATSILFKPEGDGDTTVRCFGQDVVIGSPAWPPTWYTDWKSPAVEGTIFSGYSAGGTNGVSSAVVLFNGASNFRDTADFFGWYTAQIPAGWTGTITPSVPGFTFSPASRAITGILTQQTGLDFQGTDTARPVVKLASPIGGESWIAGSTQKIAWNAATDNGAIVSRSIYWRKGGQTWQRLDTTVSDGTQGDWSWVVPGDTVNVCWVKVQFTDAAGNKGEDSSSASFNIRIAPHFTSTDTAVTVVGQDFEYQITWDNQLGGAPSFALLPESPSWVRLDGDQVLRGTPPAGNGSDTVRVTLSLRGVIQDTLELVITRNDPSVSVLKVNGPKARFGIRQAGTPGSDLAFVADLPQPGNYRIALRDVSGRKIWEHSMARARQGSYQFKLDGQYKRLHGLCFVTLQGEGKLTTLRLISMR